MFVVPEGVSLLSNAPVQFVQTDAGWMQLPLSGASPDLSAAPEILGSVAMSSGSTLNGFWVVGTAIRSARRASFAWWACRMSPSSTM